MFRIRVCTPSVTNKDGWPQAGCELRLGVERFLFAIDLRHWTIAEYERQWDHGTKRILYGSPTSALMTAYDGPEGHSHQMWGLWRDEGHMYVQQHSVINDEVDHPFHPDNPYDHLGSRIASSRYELPIPEWKVSLIEIYAAALNVRWPLTSQKT